MIAAGLSKAWHILLKDGSSSSLPVYVYVNSSKKRKHLSAIIQGVRGHSQMMIKCYLWV